MTTYDMKNIELVWRGLTLTGFGDGNKFHIKQSNESFKQVAGINGDVLLLPNFDRKWQIITFFEANSPCMPIFIQDNVDFIKGTLIVRDLNTGITDTFSGCGVLRIEEEKDYGSRKVIFGAAHRSSSK